MKMFIRNANKRAIRWIQRRRFTRSIRPTDVFLVTYPKSGTTWVGFLLANILHRMQAPALNLRTYLKYIPDINNLYYGNGDLSEYSKMPDPRFFSSHAPYDPAFYRVIYILRDPRDVMVSYWHHTKLIDSSSTLSFEEFVASKKQWPDHWHEHVKGWVVDKHKNVCVVKYEDLRADTLSAVKKMLEFIDFPFEEEVVQQAIEASKFEKMKALESEHGSGQHNNSLKGFIRRGQSGSWREEINPDALTVLEQKFGPVMRAVGYQMESNKSHEYA